MPGWSMGASHRACTGLRVSRANGSLFTACQGFLWAGHLIWGQKCLGSRSILGLARVAGASLRSLALTPPQPRPPGVQGDTFEG